MAVLPSEVPTGLVTGQFLFVNEDSVDGDTDPELVVVTGSVTFTCSVPLIRMPGKATTLIPLVFDGGFDSSGQLVPKGRTNIGIELPATNSSQFNPTNFTYKVTFDLKDAATGFSVVVPSFDIQVPEGTTVDLTSVIPVSTSPGTITVQGPKGDKGDKGDTGAAGDAAYIQQVPRIANYLKREEKLSKYKTALEAAGTTAVNIVAMGDSITEGTGTTNAINRWINLTQTALRYRHGLPVGAEWPFIPVFPKTTATGIPVTRSGNVVADTTRGLAWKAGTIDTDGVVTYTFTGTSFDLLFLKATTTGTISLTIDGGAPVTIDTNGVTNGPGTTAFRWSSGALTSGFHTVVITRAASSPAGYKIYLYGMLTYNGDETKGIRMLDAAYHGISSTYWPGARIDNHVATIMAIPNVHLVVCSVGTNDYGAGNSWATYKTNIEMLVTKLRTAGYTGSIALMNVYKGSARDEATWAGYGDQLRQIAESDADVAYFDWRMRMPDIPSPYNAGAGLGLFNDGLHPNDAGNSYISAFMTDYLSDRA